MMTNKERRRLALLEQVQSGDLTLRAAAARLDLSERQAKRVYARFKAQGDAGLVHRLRGRVGNRRSDPAVREHAMALYRVHYGDFGPTLASEYLANDHALVVTAGTLRRWLVAEGLWHRQRKRGAKRHRRPRKLSFGELVQLDGSPHDWFEGRGPCCVLMVMVDDATNWTWVRFVPSETTRAAMLIFRDWAREHGLPEQVYPDRDSIYRINSESSKEIHARTGRWPLTQFGRAMKELGVRLSCANTPQAKGRVERSNRTLQDRLIKAMRLAGISTIDEANAFAERTFLPAYNARFAKAPGSEVDAHLAVSESMLASALCLRKHRVVGNDQCVSFEGQVLQLEPGRSVPPLSRKRVEVVGLLDGGIEVRWQGQAVDHRVLASRPQSPATCETLVERVARHAEPWKPPANHPWRQTAVGPRGSAALRPLAPPP